VEFDRDGTERVFEVTVTASHVRWLAVASCDHPRRGSDLRERNAASAAIPAPSSSTEAGSGTDVGPMKSCASTPFADSFSHAASDDPTRGPAASRAARYVSARAVRAWLSSMKYTVLLARPLSATVKSLSYRPFQ